MNYLRRFIAALPLLLAFLPAMAQQVVPGKYRFEEGSTVNIAAFDADGKGLVATADREGKVTVMKRFFWRVEGGKLHQREIAYTEDRRTWTPAPDTAIEIRNITAEGFELNRFDGGWTTWKRDRDR